MTIGKTIALTRRPFVGKVMTLPFNMLSRLVITFLPRSKRLLISWLQSPSAVILEPQKIKSDTASTVSPSISHEVMGPDDLGHPNCKAMAGEMLCQEPTPGLFICTFHKSALCSFSVTKGIASHSLTQQTLRGLESGLDCGVQRCLGLCSVPDGLTEGVEELAAIGWQAENAEGFGHSGEPWKQHPT